MYSIGDHIAHPMHGAGIIDSIIVKRIDGADREYYVLKLPVGDMRVMVPVSGCDGIGVRSIISKSEAADVMDALAGIDTSMTQNWNKRYRENMAKLKSGNLIEVAEVVKGLMARDVERGLSTGERRMLHSAKQIFISEMVIALEISYEQVELMLAESMG